MSQQAASSVREVFARFLGDRCVTSHMVVQEAGRNTLGIERSVFGVLFPMTVHEVVQIVRVANEHKLKLYPISRGRNIGYGGTTPSGQDHWIVDMSRMNKIVIDPIRCTATIGPGVTQGELCEHLKLYNGQLLADVTGAGLDASIVGNILEGGFGHTPLGNRRKAIKSLEIVLGDGTSLWTGDFPGLGPDLSGIFVQSNFGIVTAMKIELLRRPEHFESFLVQISDLQNLEACIEIFRVLRQMGTVTSVVHFGNAMRVLTCTGTENIPEDARGRCLQEEEAIKFLSLPFMAAAPWNATGGLYGTKEEVWAKKKVMRRALARFATVRFFSSRKIEWLKKITGAKWLNQLSFIRKIDEGVDRYSHFHGLLLGIPTDEPLRHIFWKTRNERNAGLIWIGPTVAADQRSVRNLIKIARGIYEEYGQEFALTLSLVEPSEIVAILGISFNKTDEAERSRAHQMYHELLKAFSEKGIGMYRTGLLGMGKVEYSYGLEWALKKMKDALDSKSVIAPGRYGI